MTDDAMSPEAHLREAMAHIEAAQREADDAVRWDATLTRACTEVGAALVYAQSARRALREGDGGE